MLQSVRTETSHRHHWSSNGEPEFWLGSDRSSAYSIDIPRSFYSLDQFLVLKEKGRMK